MHNVIVPARNVTNPLIFEVVVARDCFSHNSTRQFNTREGKRNRKKKKKTQGTLNFFIDVGFPREQPPPKSLRPPSPSPFSPSSPPSVSSVLLRSPRWSHLFGSLQKLP
ncbi:hypothetical protein PUN28_017349 [Cardiocondyla obscurior]|uniref:Uncharacterized protein n=1 Tax=Cardiocondyla obscurior TaxID=286306 RepID=A0AAW2EMP3_9HYME